jgi:tRNA G37 N-methylase Trm5
MLKPHAPVGVAKDMRHLRVPRRETSLWRDKLASNGWLAEGHGIHKLEEYTGIPLSENAPSQIDELDIVELEPLISGPKHWTERIKEEMPAALRNLLPMSHDQIGDVIIVKIPDELKPYSKTIGEAMIAHRPSARIACADNGVKGDFRVRDLTVLATKETNSTRTRVREHGNVFWTDPGLVYYSPRLANERLGNLECARTLSEKLGRKISVCDPYAGVGPALIPLTKLPGIVDEIYGCDLNPHAAELLELNLPEQNTRCADALTLSTELPECCDLLLVNLPHDCIQHIPYLLGLLKKGHEVVIRGWAIIPSDSLEDAEAEIRNHLVESEVISLEIESKKSYASNIAYVGIEVHLIRS